MTVSLLGTLSKELKSAYYKYLQIHVHCCSSHQSQVGESSEVSINGQIGKENVGLPYTQ